MTEPQDPADVIDHGVTDVLTADEVVHVPAAGAELAEAMEFQHAGETFISDVADWDEPDPQP